MVLLVANRGEIALRIIRTARVLDLPTVAVYAADDADSPHVHVADEAVGLPGVGPSAYLDHDAILRTATGSQATLVHPGYGFLSESADFARACRSAGLTFVGPDAEVLAVLGDKSAARSVATRAGAPVLPATEGDTPLAAIHTFFAEQPDGIMIKALAGGGGRGMRVVRSRADIDEAYRVCAAEAELGFGSAAVFAEALLPDARHIEVQVVAASGAALALGDRDCSLQRRHQKIVEIAPAQCLSDPLRRELHGAAVRIAVAVGMRGLATVEFLVTREERYVFLEVNPRIQVEHTVTEEVTGTDLVAIQLAIAQGAGLDELGVPEGVTARAAGMVGRIAPARGIAIQTRINMETMDETGLPVPATGTLTAFTPPTGPGVRVDTFGRPGLAPSPRYDSLLAKVVTHVHSADFGVALREAAAALDEFVVDGIRTNVEFLRLLLAEPDLRTGRVTTGFIGDRLPALVAAAQTGGSRVPVAAVELHADEDVVRSPMAGTIVETSAEAVAVNSGQPLAVLEAMKMQHVLAAPDNVRTVRVLVKPGQVVGAGDPLVIFTRTGAGTTHAAAVGPDLDHIRPDLAEIMKRHEATTDAARPDAVAKRRKGGRRTARENVADLVDPGSFVEYGALTIAAQRSRRSEDDLIANTPADGLIVGIATVGAETFGRRAAECAVLSYDYTVLAGTQGRNNHAKTDRIFELAARKQIPVVLFAEGGGGRPGDTDAGLSAGLDLSTFRALASLSGQVPLIAIVSGRCFAGNAALAGVCDVIIATPDANLGMGGPAMISGGGLGTFRPEDIGPIEVQRRNGVVDLVARDDAHAVALARLYLSYFQGDIADWTAPDPRSARHVVPENRLRAYDIHRAIDAIFDVDSVLELRADFGVGVVTALVRVEGVAYGLIANSGHHLGGAIDADASDKLADFLARCNSSGLPVVSLCDTPGFMVGPETEKEATVRRFGRLFIVGSQLRVPFGTIILRKGYGLGAMAMAAGSFHASDFTIAWPTGEIGGMGLEGAVRLGFAKELAAAADPVEREKLFEQFVELAYQHGKALTSATTFELDDVIDPADSRSWIRTLPRNR